MSTMGVIHPKFILWIRGIIIITLFYTIEAKSSFKFTNVKCQDHDISFSSFETCKLNVIGRGVVSLNIRVGLYQSPVTNSTVNVAMYKRANGYRPFLYNVTSDVCAFFANRNRFMIIKVIFDTFLSYTNVNHSCPYYDAIVVKDLVLSEDKFNLFPIPEGDYLFKMKVFAYNDLKATVEVFFTRTDSFL